MGIQSKRIAAELQGNPLAFYSIGTHTQNTTLNTVQSISIPFGANGLLVQAGGKDIRYTIDGSNPTATVGFLLPAYTDPLILMAVQDGQVFKFIETAASATLDYVGIRISSEC